MATRLQAELVFIDKTTKPLQSIIGHLNATQRAFNGLKTGSVFSDIESSGNGIANKLDQAKEATKGLNAETSKSVGFFRQIRYSLLNTYIMIQAFKSTVKVIQNATDAVDQFNRTTARLKMVDEAFNGARANMNAFYDDLMSGASRSRVVYDDFAQQVSKLGLQAGHAFSGTDELMKFTELSMKSFKVAGTSPESQRAGMYQLTQALASNRLQGDEFRSIIENMPQLVQMMNKKLGVTHAELRKLASEGKLSATVIKEAMFESADEINENFAKLPLTFSEQFIKVKNAWTDAMKPVFEDLGRFANSPEFLRFIDELKQSARDVAKFIQNAIEGTVRLANFLRENKWILEGIVIVLSSILVFLIAVKVQSIIIAIATMTINWPLLIILALIGAIIFIARRLGVEWGDIWAFMKDAVITIINTVIFFVGLLVTAVVGAFILVVNAIIFVVNVVNGVINVISTIIEDFSLIMENIMIGTITFIQNLWYQLKYSIESVIYDVQVGWADFVANLKSAWGKAMNWLGTKMEGFANGVIRLLNSLATYLNNSKLFKGINTVLEKAGFSQIVFGMTGEVSWKNLDENVAPDYSGLIAPTLKTVEPVYNKISSFGEAFDKGMDTLKYIDYDKTMGSLTSFFDDLLIDLPKDKDIWDTSLGKDPYSGWGDDPTAGLFGDEPAGGGAGGGGSGSPNVGTVGKIKEPVKLSDEAMKLLRQLRDGEFMRGYATVNPNIYLTYTSNNNGSADENVKRNAQEMQRMILEELATNLRLP